MSLNLYVIVNFSSHTNTPTATDGGRDGWIGG